MIHTIVVVGLGSMGRRRLSLLKKLRPGLRLCGVDLEERRRQQAEETLSIPVYASLSEAVQAQNPDAAVISTSPLSHAAIIRECLLAGLHIFTEINLVSDGYEENMALAKEKNRVLFLSSTFLYRSETRYIIDRAKGSTKPLNYRYHTGQYLPDWHPWENYTDYFVGDSRTNGCREVFTIELPWLAAAFGPITNIQTLHGKCSDLRISYSDSYMLLLQHESGHMGSLCVDVVSRKAGRQFEVYGENLYLSWAGDPSSLYDWDIEKKEDRQVSLYETVEHREGYSKFIVENAYSEELTAFLNQVEYGQKVPYTFEDDLLTLQWIDKIEGRGAP